MRRGLVKEKTERAFWKKTEGEGGRMTLHPLNVEGKKTLSKMDVDKYKDPSVWVNVQMLKLLRAPLLSQPLLAHALTAETSIQSLTNCGYNTVDWNATMNTPNLANLGSNNEVELKKIQRIRVTDFYSYL